MAGERFEELLYCIGLCWLLEELGLFVTARFDMALGDEASPDTFNRLKVKLPTKVLVLVFPASCVHTYRTRFIDPDTLGCIPLRVI